MCTATRRMALVASMALLGALVLCGRASALDLVSNGEPRATVVLPQKPDAWTQQAGEWVLEYVKKATGATLALANEPGPAEGNIIAVGHTELAKNAGVSLDGLKWDGGKLVVRGRTLFLLGRDEAPPEERRAHLGARGTCKAAVTFLEKFLGVRWLVPGPNGEYVPQTRDVAVPDDLDVTVQPIFAYGHGRYLYGVNTPGSFANNFRTAVKMKTFGGHSWPVWVPVKKYGKTHPEYFYFDGKKRHPMDRNHLCTTNPEVKDILLREIRKVFDAGYDWCQLAQSDGFRRCQCPNCEKLDNYRGWKNVNNEEFFFHTLRDNPCERVLLLHKAIIDACAKSHPNKKVHLLVYGPTSWPSKKFDRFGDNVISEVCHHYEQTLPVWRDKVAAQTVYVYFWGTYKPQGIGPKFTPSQVARMIRLFRDNNVIGVYYCGGGECWGLDGPAYYTAGRLMGDPDLPVDQLVREYCDGLYRGASDAMYAFFQDVFKRVEAMRTIAVYGRATNNTETLYTVGFPPAVLTRLEQRLKAAERAADTERARMWVKLSRDEFDYVKHTAIMYHYYRAYQLNRSAENFVQLRQAVADRKAHLDKILAYDKEYASQWFPGLSVMRGYFSKRGRARRHLRAPVTWDFEEMGKQYEGMAGGKPEAALNRIERKARKD